MTDEARFLKKKNSRLEFGSNKWVKIGLETIFFCHFPKFDSLVFLEIGYNDSLQRYLTFSRGEIYEKKIWGQNVGQKSKNQAQNKFIAIFSICHFPSNCIQ